MSDRIHAPELTGAAEWFNVPAPLTLRALRGKVVLLDFWTYGCINCMHVIPDLRRLEEKYRDELVVTARTGGGVIMGVEHRDHPVYGVQFHPESVLTEGGYRMVGNWLQTTGLDGAAERAADLNPRYKPEADRRNQKAKEYYNQGRFDAALQNFQSAYDLYPEPRFLFNIALALLFIFWTEKIARVAERLLPNKPLADDPAKPRNLDPSALDTPPLAIANAAREAMRIGDVVEDMLNGMLQVIKSNDRNLAAQIRKKDDVVDDLYTAVKLYLTQISREALDEKEGRRWADIVSFTINLEQVGDIIERVLSDIVDKKISKHRSFSDAGMAEICDLHARLVANLRLGMSVFLHGDLKSAQELLAQKVLFRDLERAYADSHLGRLAGNTLESIETSSLHLDLISDFKRINSHICSIAYPILEEAGVLARTRLMEPAPAPIVMDDDGDLVPGEMPPQNDWPKQKPKTA